MNCNKPFKPNLPNASKPSKLLAPIGLCLTLSSLAFRIPQFTLYCIRHLWHLPILPKNQKQSQHFKWVWVVFGYKSSLNGYNNGRGKEKRLQRFLSKNEQLSLIRWVCYRNFSQGFPLNKLLTIFVDNEGIYSMSDGNMKSHNFQ